MLDTGDEYGAGGTFLVLVLAGFPRGPSLSSALGYSFLASLKYLGHHRLKFLQGLRPFVILVFSHAFLCYAPVK